jgi:hypothetical protein
MLAKITASNSETVINALIKHAHKLPSELYKSLTWDRGEEMAGHQRLHSPLIWMCISVIRAGLGSVVQTKKQTAFSGSTSQGEPIYLHTPE